MSKASEYAKKSTEMRPEPLRFNVNRRAFEASVDITGGGHAKLRLFHMDDGIGQNIHLSWADTIALMNWLNENFGEPE